MARCRESDAHVVRSVALRLGCLAESIALSATILARSTKVRCISSPFVKNTDE